MCRVQLLERDAYLISLLCLHTLLKQCADGFVCFVYRSCAWQSRQARRACPWSRRCQRCRGAAPAPAAGGPCRSAAIADPLKDTLAFTPSHRAAFSAIHLDLDSSFESVTCPTMQGCAPRLCRACGAAAKAALKRGSLEGPPSGAAKSGKKQSGAGGVHRASGGAGAKAGKAGKPKGSGGGGAAKARVHLAQPAVRGVTAARAERSTHRHKKLFTSEPGALTVRCAHSHKHLCFTS